MLMGTSLLLNNIRSNSVDLLKVQTQLTTGLKLARPSDNPAEASTIMHLDSRLEQQEQFFDNISYAADFLASTDDALAQAGQLADEAHTLALASVGRSQEEKASNAVMIDQILQQLINIGNYTCRGSFIFGGQNNTQAPFEGYEGGVVFNGDISDLQTRVAQYNMIGFNTDGNDTFGALSSQVEGIVDLDPDIAVGTLLSDLNGALGQGIRKSSILVSDGLGNSATVDLSNCVTVGDVIKKIEDAVPTISVSVAGNGLDLTAAGGNISVLEVGTGYTARDLGIYSSGAGVTLNGQDVDARLTATTPIAALLSGAGIDTINGLQITNSMMPPISPIDISAAQTLGDVLNAINLADIGVRAEINADATGINVFNQLSGSEMTIAENGGTTAGDLGIRSFHGQTLLADLNGGTGVATTNDNIPGAIRITDRTGATYDVDLSTAVTIQDVIDLINAATGGNVIAALVSTGNGIELTDTTAAVASNLSVTTLSENGYFVAEQLGLNKSVAANVLTGDDVNPVKPNGLFSHLIALRDALLSDDDQAIEDMDNAIQTDRVNISNYRGVAGATLQAVEDRRDHTEDNILATKTLRSDIRDIDFTEAITKYQNLYTALQGNLMTGNQLTNVSLLDFLI